VRDAVVASRFTKRGGARYVGSSVDRVEDQRLLTGQGRYVDDVAVPGMLHATFLRSVHAHAMIRSIDTMAARALPGVHAVLTGGDMARLTYPFVGLLALEGLYQPTFYALATDRVRLVGDPVAIVVAETRGTAEDACELITVDYEPLPPVASAAQALGEGAPKIWPKAPSNVLYRSSETFGDVDAAFASADQVVTERFSQHRQSNQPMEARAILAEVDPETGGLTVRASTQAVHTLRWSLALLLGRQPVRTTLRRLVRQREQTKRVVTGVRSYLAATPALVAATKQSAATMVKQAVGNPERQGQMVQAFLALIAKSPSERAKVVVGDVGGAFGAKTVVHREDVAVCAAAMHLGRSVKWVEDRQEHLTSGAHAREEDLEVQVAVMNDGTVLGMKARLTMDAGAYPAFPFGAPIFARMIQLVFPGPYRLPALQFSSRVVATNKSTYVAYRGPWAVETWVRERMYDVVARHLGLSRADIRLQNMIGPDELPTAMVTGPALDVRMSARRTLERALEIAEFDSWQKVQAEARAEGRRLGLGFATYIEAAPGPPGFFDHLAPGFGAIVDVEPISAVLEADGTVSLHTQQVPHGQGHETTLIQVAADELGVPIELVRLRYGDTQRAPFGVLGTGASRSAAMAGGAVTLAAGSLRERILDVAADLLEAARSDLVLEDGRVSVRGTPSIAVSTREVASAVLQRNGELEASGAAAAKGSASEAIRVTETFTGGEGGWAQATHVCWVDVDLETGLVRIPRYVVVEDCGEIINPTVVAGQIRGGVAQGVGAVLYEKATYDPSGAFQASTFMDYLIPTAMEIPPVEIHHIGTPSDVFANYRGVGEGGLIGAPAAITNAIEDALSEFGVTITEQHLPPTRILELAGVIPARR
jgi:carbon-monoxide dehydrogenase large subunit